MLKIELFMTIELEEMSGVPYLKQAFIEVLNQFLEVEQGHINTRHPDFVINATEAINNGGQGQESSRQCELTKETDKKLVGLAKRERNEVELIGQMIGNYSRVIKKNTCDYVPKIVLTLLLHKTIDACESELVTSLHHEEAMDRILEPNED